MRHNPQLATDLSSRINIFVYDVERFV